MAISFRVPQRLLRNAVDPFLEVQLRRQLYFTRSPLEENGLTGRRNDAGIHASNLGIGVVELRNIEDVECLRAELKIACTGFVEMNRLEERYIELLGSGPKEDIAGRVPEGVLRRRHEVRD